jgi:outer membrane protein W
MKKLVSVFVAVGCLLVISNQSKAQISAGVTGGALIWAQDGESMTFPGGTLTLRYGISDNIRIGANLGYFFKSETIDDISVSTFWVPITGAIEYSFGGEKFSPYAGLDLGLYRSGVSIDDDELVLSVSSSFFGFAPTLGMMYDLSDNLALNVNAKYHYILPGEEGDPQSLIGIGAGIVLKF